MSQPLLDSLQDSAIFDLEQPRYPGSPVLDVHEPGFRLFLHRRHEAEPEEPRTSASALIVSTEHCGTHIDALCHQAENGVLCDGTEIGPRIQTHHGISHLDTESMSPIICRGVLVDIGGHTGESPPDVIDLDLFEQVIAGQGTEIQPGDAVLVRTGNGSHYQDVSRYIAGPGVAGPVSEWLAARSPVLVGADNIAWDSPGHVDPKLETTLPGHVHLICRAGIHIIENMKLDDLALARAYEFTFICIPLKMRGATASPVRPLALV